MAAPISLIKTRKNWLHKHFEPQQVDVVVSSILYLSLTLFFHSKCRFTNDDSKISSLIVRSGDNASFVG